MPRVIVSALMLTVGAALAIAQPARAFSTKVACDGLVRSLVVTNGTDTPAEGIRVRSGGCGVTLFCDDGTGNQASGTVPAVLHPGEALTAFTCSPTALTISFRPDDVPGKKVAVSTVNRCGVSQAFVATCDGGLGLVAVTNGTDTPVRAIRLSGGCGVEFTCVNAANEPVGEPLALDPGFVADAFACPSEAVAIVVAKETVPKKRVHVQTLVGCAD